MSRLLQKKVNQFFQTHNPERRLMVLALSGGCDSLSLFHLLYELNIPFCAAYFDHGWRKESEKEADFLKKYVESFGVSFYSNRKNENYDQTNNVFLKKESIARDQRYQFLVDTAKETQAFAIVTAHHLDDQAETVLKRLLESASLIHLKGIEKSSLIQGIHLFRPLLEVKKKLLSQFLQDRSIEWLEDSSNQDPQFLRNRMRLEMFPLLQSSFGKKVSQSLVDIAKESKEIENYFKKKLASMLSSIEKGPFGSWFIFPENMEMVEIQQMINLWLNLGRKACYTLASWVDQGAQNRFFSYQHQSYYIDRRLLLVLKKDLNLSFSINTIPNSSKLHKPSSWRDLLRGFACVSLEQKEYTLYQGFYRENKIREPFDGSKTLDRFWTQYKVPAFFRSRVPVLVSDKNVVHEFLSGHYKRGQKPDGKPSVLVELKINTSNC